MKTKKSAISIFLAVAGLLICFQSVSADNFKPSQKPPGGLDAKKVPQFITLGWDDNGFADAMNWILDYMKSKKNPNGTPLKCTFYITALYGADTTEASKAVKASWKRAYNEGHEIGNHTFSHAEGMAGWPQAQWKATMDSCTDFLVKEIGVPRAQIYGFRTPFLAFDINGMNTHKAAKEAGFLYDCTLNGGSEAEFNGSDYYWPYTLDEGNIGSEHYIKPVPGLWEVPTHRYRLPSGGHMTGFDYNLWKEMEYNKSQFIAVYKNTLDLRYNGNRCPFTLGAHTDYYSKDNEWANKDIKNSTWQDRRAAIEEFITYALTKPDVRFVTAKFIIDYMKDPYTVDNEKTAIDQTVKAKGIAPAIALKNNGESIELTVNQPDRYRLTMVDLHGKQLYAGAYSYLAKGTYSFVTKGIFLPKGMYVVQLQGSGTATTIKRISIN
ncbi:MAG: polysaccharide deacetylase family protein [Chitinivibrionales bacterium]|nr:polysaccharide deacetylase family protein [Chitinivibrionales bacterium]